MKRLFNLLLPVLLAVFCTTAWAGQDLELVDGEHWVSSSHEQKRAFLIGVGNILEIEEAMAGDDYALMRGRSIIPVLLEGLSGTSIDSMVAQLNKFYAAHPDQADRPVIEVLYLEMALPNL